jgi:hypothetical protein
MRQLSHPPDKREQRDNCGHELDQSIVDLLLQSQGVCPTTPQQRAERLRAIGASIRSHWPPELGPIALDDEDD